MGLSVESERRITNNLAAIDAYMARHGELRTCHHWLYDSRYPRTGTPMFVVLGLNPGETTEDLAMAVGPAEETSRSDFRDRDRLGKSSKRWKANSEFFLDGADYVLTELFFWSSANAGRAFLERYGILLSRSPHLQFCASLNRDLIDVHQPLAVVAPGLAQAEICRELYGLRPVRTAWANNKHRLVEHWTDGIRPWIFTKHWSGGFGFSREQRDRVRQEIMSARAGWCSAVQTNDAVENERAPIRRGEGPLSVALSAR